MVCLVALMASCRRNQPSLVDRNQPPDTQLWYAPPDSTEYEYLVHLYWRGVDRDGETSRFVWSIQDTLALGEAYWNPAERLRDYRLGRITERTDSVFSFTAYKDVAGVGVRKNRQAFLVAAIDDNGVIDPVPAGVEFVATIGTLPEIRFTNYINGAARPYTYRSIPSDTVGMFKPFSISYHGLTTNGSLRGYFYYALSATIMLPGAGVWTDIADTLRDFPNTGTDAFPAGVFRFAAKCIDDANAESQIDAGQFRRGVSQVVVNFDPDTRIVDVKNTYFKNQQPFVETVDFTDGVPDTVPYGSWLYYRYFAFDDDRDVWQCSSTDPDSCIDFQVRYVRNSSRVPGAREDSNWLPRSGRHDSDPYAATDSNTVNAGSLEYDFYVAGIDENGSRDGTAPSIHIIGNYDPTMDTVGLVDHFNDPVNLATVDTLTWNFYKGVGWPYNSPSDTTAIDGRFFKRFAWTVSGTGHDHPKDPDGSAIKAWRYFVYTNYNPATGTGTFWPLGRAGQSWFAGVADNVMSDRFELTIRYDDPEGDDVFASLPAYFNNTITMVLYGRDTRLGEGDFAQYVFWDEVAPGDPAGTGVSTRHLINSFNTEVLGRWTPQKVVTFYLKFER
jgi:hypothetical protein